MKRRRFLGAAATLALSLPASSQGWPTKPVRVIVPFPPGGATDIVGRLIAQKLTDLWGQALLIENRGGAGGNIAAGEVARSPADGYTLFFTSGSVVTANEFIYKHMAFSPERDFEAVTNCASGPQVLVVPSS